ncbi:hypothetical protein [uncultured Oscillibacter sp.]|uniref:immunity protein Imm33 domain-containing protein n=1 Tax=uncultured Oscillibacter sp. TaxID=876091 RepID=UPI00262CE6A0|nr:hypothetical protein [uncultured Oscillibacter sp.]
MKYTYNINGKPVSLSCREEWKPTADFLAGVLLEEEKAGGILEDGSIIQIGWSFYKFVKQGPEFRMLTFDYVGDPFSATEEDLSLSLRIFHEQTEVLNKAAAQAVTTSFQDTMLMKKTARKADTVYLQRLEPTCEGDSGWYMGVIGEDGSEDPNDYTRICTYQLLSFCEAALALMPLPLGTIGLFERGQLVEVVDENNKNLF